MPPGTIGLNPVIQPLRYGQVPNHIHVGTSRSKYQITGPAYSDTVGIFESTCNISNNKYKQSHVYILAKCGCIL